MRFGRLFQLGPGSQVREFVLEQERVLIGRGYECDVLLEDETVSRHHALLFCGKACRLTDLGSANGSSVNGTVVNREPVNLKDGDAINIGDITLRYAAEPEEADPTTPAPGETIEYPQTRTLADVRSATRPAAAETLLTKALVTGTLGEMLAGASTQALTSDLAREAVVSVVLSGDGRPRLLVRESGVTRTVPLCEGTHWIIGRHDGSSVRLGTDRASRVHARLERIDGGFRLTDLGSRNGTLLNGAPVRETFLKDGDTVRIGSAAIVYRAGSSERSADDRSGTGSPRPLSPLGRSMPRRPVIVVPGLCGTELTLSGRRIWPNYLNLITCSEARLSDYWGDLQVGRVVREVVVVPGLVRMEAFGRLTDFLCAEMGYREGVDLLEFGYDWRQDNRASARELKNRIGSWRPALKDPHAKFIVIAHSMGGLLSRYYLEHLGGGEACERLITLGTPHSGSARAFQLLIEGRGSGTVAVAAEKIRAMVRRFPSTYQLLPAYAAVRLTAGDAFTPLEDDTWMAPSERRHHAGARAFRSALEDTQAAAIPTTCIFGYGQKTLREVQVERSPSGALSVRGQVFAPTGDDAVTEESAILERAEIHPVRQRHGALYADKDVQRRLRYELLERRVPPVSVTGRNG